MLSLELRDWIARYISTEISLEELENWVVSHLPELAADPHSDDSALAAAVDLCLAEYSDGIRTEEEIRHYLRDALSLYRTIKLSTPDMVNCSQAISTSSAVTQNRQFNIEGNKASILSRL